MKCVVWAFDLDGTLIGSVRSERLRPGAAELLDALAGHGVECILWSAGGADYARRRAGEHGLADRFVEYYAKAMRDHSTRYVVDHFDIAHRPDVFVDDSPIDLPIHARVVPVPQFIGGNTADRALFDVIDALDDLIAGVRL